MRSLAVSTRGADWSITSVPFVEPAAPSLAVPGLSHLVVGARLSDACVMTSFQEEALSREGGFFSALPPSLGITQHDARHIRWARIGSPGFVEEKWTPSQKGAAAESGVGVSSHPGYGQAGRPEPRPMRLLSLLTSCPTCYSSHFLVGQFKSNI